MLWTSALFSSNTRLLLTVTPHTFPMRLKNQRNTRCIWCARAYPKLGLPRQLALNTTGEPPACAGMGHVRTCRGQAGWGRKAALIYVSLLIIDI